MKKSDFGLPMTTIIAIQSVFAKNREIEEVVIYGSRAKGTSKKGSDIDLSITKSNDDLSLLYKIEDELDDLLLPFEMDLSLFEHIDNPGLTKHIKRVGKIFYSRS